MDHMKECAESNAGRFTPNSTRMNDTTTRNKGALTSGFNLSTGRQCRDISAKRLRETGNIIMKPVAPLQPTFQLPLQQRTLHGLTSPRMDASRASHRLGAAGSVFRASPRRGVINALSLQLSSIRRNLHALRAASYFTGSPQRNSRQITRLSWKHCSVPARH